MNLHIVPDNVFINNFYNNLQESGTVDNNKIIVRTPYTKLKSIRHNLPFGRLYSSEFSALTGDTASYKKVFIHQFTPLLYKWVAKNEFRELDWMVWGADLYNLPSVRLALYEPKTRSGYIWKKVSLQDLLYRTKVKLLHGRHEKTAYAKVNNVLTWMTSEYEFALRHLPTLRAQHQFFFYENQMPYQALDQIMLERKTPVRQKHPAYILGNSATSELNHLDALASMSESGVQADLLVPVSYGDSAYARFLKKNVSFYKGGKIEFLDRYMNFKEYLELLYGSDGLIMNNIRPQGYGNIFMMMYLGKKIFLNEKNLSIPELARAGLTWQPVTRIGSNDELKWNQNKALVAKLLSHSVLLNKYRELFS
jgi:dTDP-N-acetylfucosamine:lipid II N-acetylfucosaminyltransferase